MPSRSAFVALSLPASLGSLLPIRASASDGFFAGLGDLPGGQRFSVAYAVSGDGNVAAGTSEASFNVPTERAFRWRRSRGMQNLGTPTRTALGVSFDGSVVVGHGGSGGVNVFRWTESTGTVGIPGMGLVGGVSYDGTRVAGSRSDVHEACIWTGSIMGLGDLPGGSFYSQALAISGDGGTVVGDSQSADGYEAFRWTEATGMEGLGDLPGGLFEGVAEAVSADGSVVVGWSYSTGWEAFRWTTATGIVGLGRLEGSSWAYGVSADGEVVVGHDSSAGAFVWDPGHGMRSVQDLLTTTYPGLIPAGWALSLAADVSADGLTVVGTGINPAGDSEAWIADLPCCEVLAFCPTDLDCNGQTDITDLALLLSHFGSCPADPDFWPRANIDRWGCVDLADLSRLLGAFGTACQ